MAIIVQRIGPISAYAIAKEEGYTGTKAEFAHDMGNSASNAHAAAESASAAEISAASAASSASQAMSTTPAGYNSMMESIAKEYDPDNGTYEAGDYCRFNSEIYQCIADIDTPGPWDATKWEKVTIGEELNQQGTIIKSLPTEKTAYELLAKLSESLLLTKIITAGVSEKLDDLDEAKEDISNIESVVSALPSDHTAQEMLNEEQETVRLVRLITDGISSLPTESTAQDLLNEEKETLKLAQIISFGLAEKFEDIDDKQSEFQEALNALPSEANAEGILTALNDSNMLLDIIKNGVESLISNIDSKENIPEYFETEITQSIADYRINQEAIGHNGDSFVFITDTHWGANQKHSPQLIKYLIDNSNLRNVFCGGDVLDSSSQANELAKGYDFMAKFAFVPGGMKCVIGNHDWNRNSHESASSYWMSLNQTYAVFCPKGEMEMQDVQCIEPDTGMYEISYYVDVPATNIRYLFISLPFGSAYTATLDWAEQLIESNPEKNFILFSHFLYKNTSGERAGGANALIYRIQGYSNVKAWLFGHIHADCVFYTDTGIPLVGTDTDSSRLAASNKYSYTVGTITEQAFDIVTVDITGRNVECVRVGRGKDRRVNGGVNSVSIGGSASLTTGLPGTVTWESSNTAIATVSNGTVTGVASGSAVITAVGENKEEYWFVTVS